MESLTNLATSLPTSNLVNAEKDLLNNFKAAALSITTLYKSSLRTSKRAYNSGYASACQDLLLMIQQGVSAGESSDPHGSGMTIGRVMDYLEARLEALRSREEEEDEDEERDRERERQAKAPSNAAKTSVPAASSSRPRDFGSVAPMTPVSPPASISAPAPAQPSTPTPSPQVLSRPQAANPPPSLQRNSRARQLTNVKEAVIASSSTFSPLMSTPIEPALAIIPPPSTSNMSPFPASEATGSKRRHSAISSDTSTSSISSSTTGISRRRTIARNTRNLASAFARETNDQNLARASDDMDIEDEGRERKRVARR